MAIKVDLHSVREGRESGVGTNTRKGGRGGRKFAGQKGKLRNIEEDPQCSVISVSTNYYL